jgi:hypothetical protein
MTGLRHVRTIVVAHGASELILCRSIRTNLRLPLEIITENQGSKCIQVNVLEKFFSEKNFAKYLAQSPGIQKFQLRDGELVNTTIFPIMDTDDCSKDTLKRYMSGEMFSGSPYSSMIKPIFNSPNLDSVMEEIGFTINRKEKRKSYERIFPGENGDLEAASGLLDLVSDLQNSNFKIFLEHCIKEARKNSYNKSF